MAGVVIITKGKPGELVNLVDSMGVYRRDVPIEEALKEAENTDSDLMQIANETATERKVCRVLNYSKYLYEKKKQDKENRKKAQTTEIKEIRLTVVIDDHDLEIKAKKASEMLKAGNIVRITLRYKGRQLAHKELGYAVAKKFIQEVEKSTAITYQAPKVAGNTLTAQLTLNRKSM